MLSTMMLVLALSGSGREIIVTWDECHDAAWYAGAAAEARDAGKPMADVLSQDLKAYDSPRDLAWRMVGLKIGYGTDLTPDKAAAAAFHDCLTIGKD